MQLSVMTSFICGAEGSVASDHRTDLSFRASSVCSNKLVYHKPGDPFGPFCPSRLGDPSSVSQSKKSRAAYERAINLLSKVPAKEDQFILFLQWIPDTSACAIYSIVLT